jgi:hypothetical protein
LGNVRRHGSSVPPPVASGQAQDCDEAVHKPWEAVGW